MAKRGDASIARSNAAIAASVSPRQARVRPSATWAAARPCGAGRGGIDQFAADGEIAGGIVDRAGVPVAAPRRYPRHSSLCNGGPLAGDGNFRTGDDDIASGGPLRCEVPGYGRHHGCGSSGGWHGLRLVRRISAPPHRRSHLTGSFPVAPAPGPAAAAAAEEEEEEEEEEGGGGRAASTRAFGAAGVVLTGDMTGVPLGIGAGVLDPVAATVGAAAGFDTIRADGAGDGTGVSAAKRSLVAIHTGRPITATRAAVASAPISARPSRQGAGRAAAGRAAGSVSATPSKRRIAAAIAASRAAGRGAAVRAGGREVLVDFHLPHPEGDADPAAFRRGPENRGRPKPETGGEKRHVPAL